MTIFWQMNLVKNQECNVTNYELIMSLTDSIKKIKILDYSTYKSGTC